MGYAGSRQYRSPSASHFLKFRAAEFDFLYIVQWCSFLLGETPKSESPPDPLGRALWDSALVALRRNFDRGARPEAAEIYDQVCGQNVGIVRLSEALEHERRVRVAHAGGAYEHHQVGFTLNPAETHVVHASALSTMRVRPLEPLAMFTASFASELRKGVVSASTDLSAVAADLDHVISCSLHLAGAAPLPSVVERRAWWDAAVVATCKHVSAGSRPEVTRFLNRLKRQDSGIRDTFGQVAVERDNVVAHGDARRAAPGLLARPLLQASAAVAHALSRKREQLWPGLLAEIERQPIDKLRRRPLLANRAVSKARQPGR